MSYNHMAVDMDDKGRFAPIGQAKIQRLDRATKVNALTLAAQLRERLGDEGYRAWVASLTPAQTSGIGPFSDAIRRKLGEA